MTHKQTTKLGRDWYAHRFVLLYSEELDGWLIYDRLRYLISDGMYYEKASAQDVCDFFNEDHARGDRDWYAKERERDHKLGWSWHDFARWHRERGG